MIKTHLELAIRVAVTAVTRIMETYTYEKVKSTTHGVKANLSQSVNTVDDL